MVLDECPHTTNSGADGIEGEWLHVPVRHIEDLKDAIYGAGLSATQMSRAPLRGSLIFRERDGITYSSGHLNARVSLTGPLSESMVTFGIGVILAPGTRHWLQEVDSGDVGLFMAGDEHDALYFPGSLYAGVTMTAERAEEIAAAAGRVLDVRKLGGSGVNRQGVRGMLLADLQRGFVSLHAGIRHEGVCDLMLRSVIEHFGRLPQVQIGPAEYRGYSRIALQGREYINDHLSTSLSIDAVAAAIGTSPRTLFRAFNEVVGETPLNHIRRMRLHRVRHDLLTDGDAGTSIAAIANRWGIGELGRMSRWYRELFGELPSQTKPRRSPGRVQIAANSSAST